MQHIIAARSGSPFAMTPSPNAFDGLRPITPDYPTLPIAEGFNWPDALRSFGDVEWYLVVFRSLRKATANTEILTEFDDRAHMEALVAGGLLFYFQGQLNLRRECLSFCIWESRQQALEGARLPLHQEATAIVDEMYDHYRLERYWIRKHAGSAEVSIERMINYPVAQP
jgi:heme-degrading monooxygenase HmoA